MMLVAVTAFGGSLRAYSRIQVWGHDDVPNLTVHFDPDRSDVIARAAYGYIAREGRWLNALLFPLLQHLSGKLAVYLTSPSCSAFC